MKIRQYLKMVAIILFACVMISGMDKKALAKEKNDTICTGVFIDSIDVGGMTKEEAEEAIRAYVNDLKSKKLIIKVDDNQVETTLADLGYVCADNNYIEEALNVGKSGNLVKRYKELKDVEHDRLVYNLEFSVNKVKIQTLVATRCSKFDIKPIDSTLSRKKGKFVVTDHAIGRAVQVEETVGKIQNVFVDDWDKNDIMIEAIVIDDLPEYTRELMEKCNKVLGTYSTTYYSSTVNRANNIANAAGLLNATIIFPGETISASDGMSPITIDNGYHIGGAYLNGKVVDSVGGGVCQVSTTLYNAALAAELEIVERFNHSMIVSYVEPAMDAAIAGTYKDLKIKNNTDAPVYIEAVTEGRKVTFTIYGNETRDTVNRKVEYRSETVDVIQPGKEKVTKDDMLPTTYRRVTQSAHVGYKAYLWKIVYKDGVEVSREKVNYSSYAAEPARVIVGTKEEEPAPTESAKPVKKKKPKKQDKTEFSEGDQVVDEDLIDDETVIEEIIE